MKTTLELFGLFSLGAILYTVICCLVIRRVCRRTDFTDNEKFAIIMLIPFLEFVRLVFAMFDMFLRCDQHLLSMIGLL